ncbi:carbohydrate esterase family 4 protein [Sphaerobolus stellatus SS14]|nr:carbohydrate esterase family 4 protein [Sphaerobolus stellatus SS14]
MVMALQTAYADGHKFGSHTWHHYDLTTLPWDGTGGIHDEMWRTELALQRILGVSPALMRPPDSNYNDQVRSAAYLRNQSRNILWDFDDGHSSSASVTAQQAAHTNVTNAHPNNILTLNHETYATTLNNILPSAITTLRNKGYTFVTVSQCLGINPYQWTAAPQTRTQSFSEQLEL